MCFSFYFANINYVFEFYITFDILVEVLCNLKSCLNILQIIFVYNLFYFQFYFMTKKFKFYMYSTVR